MVVDPDCDSEKVDKFVSDIVQGSQVNRLHGKELDITLPHDQVNNFAGKYLSCMLDIFILSILHLIVPASNVLLV